LIKGDIDRAPEVNAFHDQRIYWVDIADGLVNYRSASPALTRYQSIMPKPD
jgi:hypothetical protein